MYIIGLQINVLIQNFVLIVKDTTTILLLLTLYMKTQKVYVYIGMCRFTGGRIM